MLKTIVLLYNFVETMIYYISVFLDEYVQENGVFLNRIFFVCLYCNF